MTSLFTLQSSDSKKRVPSERKKDPHIKTKELSHA
jgi:hypothetical protein